MNTAKIVVLGKSGQVASALQHVLPNAVFLGRDNLDLANINAIAPLLKTHAPQIIINAAAHTGVDRAETEQEICDTINHKAVAEIAAYCKANNCLLVHYSTDYVFDGSGEKPFKESDTANLNPINFYGQTKLNAEKAIIASGCNYLILRTSWVYYQTGTNFIKTMLRLGEAREEIGVVNDQIGSPTYAADIAENTLKLLEKGIKNEVIHFVPEQRMSWHEFALLIFETARAKNIPLKINKVNAIPTSAYPTPAKRPANSRLDVSKLNACGINFPEVKTSVSKCIEEICNLTSAT